MRSQSIFYHNCILPVYTLFNAVALVLCARCVVVVLRGTKYFENVLYTRK